MRNKTQLVLNLLEIAILLSTIQSKNFIQIIVSLFILFIIFVQDEGDS